MTIDTDVFVEMIKIASFVTGSPQVITGWEIFDFGIIIDHENGFTRLKWEDIPLKYDISIIKKKLGERYSFKLSN